MPTVEFAPLSLATSSDGPKRKITTTTIDEIVPTAATNATIVPALRPPLANPGYDHSLVHHPTTRTLVVGQPKQDQLGMQIIHLGFEKGNIVWNEDSNGKKMKLKQGYWAVGEGDKGPITTDEKENNFTEVVIW